MADAPTPDERPDAVAEPAPDESRFAGADDAALAEGMHPTPQAAALESGVPQPHAADDVAAPPVAEPAEPVPASADAAARTEGDHPSAAAAAAESGVPQPAPDPGEPQPAEPSEAAASEPQPAEPTEAAAGDPQGPGDGRRKGGRRKPRRKPAGAPPRPSRPPRAKLPLPFGELRAAAQALGDVHGGRQALRDAFAVLGDKERKDLGRLVSDDGEWRVRARNIAAGSLGAGRVGKALAAQVVSIAQVEDVWAVTLPKEEAAQRLTRVRTARERDDRRRRRTAERERRSERVSRDELARAQDGRVGAQIRIVLDEPREKRSKKKERRQGTTDDLLSRLGY
jgi:hypothetical protein